MGALRLPRLTRNRKIALLFIVIAIVYLVSLGVTNDDDSGDTPEWVKTLGSWFPSPLEAVRLQDLKAGGDSNLQGRTWTISGDARLTIAAAPKQKNKDEDDEYRSLKLKLLNVDRDVVYDYEDRDSSGDGDDEAESEVPKLEPDSEEEIVVGKKGGVIRLQWDMETEELPLRISIIKDED